MSNRVQRRGKGSDVKPATGPMVRRSTRPLSSWQREADEILATVRALWKDLLRNPIEDAERHGMTGPQVAVMTCLVTRGPMTLTELSRILGMSHSSASGIVDRLQARGLLRRTEDPIDGRRSPIEVTENVRRYVGELEEGPSGRLVRVLKTATPAQRAAIKRGLALLTDLLGSRRQRDRP